MHQSPSIQPYELHPPSFQHQDLRPSSRRSAELQPPSVHPLARRSPSVQPLERRSPSGHPFEHRSPSIRTPELRPPSMHPPEHLPPSTHTQEYGTGSTKIPQTTITPPTPAKPSDDPPGSSSHLFDPTLSIGHDDTADSAAPLVEERNDFDEETQEGTNGRLRDATRQIMDEGYKEIDKMFSSLAERASMNIDKLISGYYKSFLHKTIPFNTWNTYQIYFKEHRDAEVGRTYPPGRSEGLNGVYSY
jgi:hypothetical protein